MAFQATFWGSLLAVLGCGLVGGVFFAFSNFVMRGLGRLPAPEGIAAMQAVNITVINSGFMGIFLGTAALSLYMAIAAIRQWGQAGAIYWLAGSLLYLIGSFGVTIACNVPLNDGLANVDPQSVEGAKIWSHYLVWWTVWNHVRTVASIAAGGCFLRSLI